MAWPKNPPEWSKGRSHDYLRPYWDGHMFVAVYLRARGYSLRETGNAIGTVPERVRQLVKKAERIVAARDRRNATSTAP